jgi:hypothetical protein
MIAGKLPEDWAAGLPKWQPGDKAIATRVAGGLALNALAQRIPNLMGGSADLNPSTETALKGLGDFQPPEAEGPGTQGAVGGEWGYAGATWLSECASTPWARRSTAWRRTAACCPSAPPSWCFPTT